MNLEHQIYWDPWVGCSKVSDGCKNCFILESEFKFYGVSHLRHKKSCEIPLGSVFVMLNSDFFLEAADNYRKDAWTFIRDNPNYIFLLITKRIECFYNNLPADWGDGYENVIISVTTENQEMADKRLPIFKELPIKHKWISVAPMLEQIDISKYLAEGWIEHVEATGEKAIGAVKDIVARELNYEWVENLAAQCRINNVRFTFMSCGTNFKYNGHTFKDHCACYHSCLAQGLELDVKIPIIFKLKDSIEVLD